MRDANFDLPGIGLSYGFYRGRVGLSALLAGLDLAPGSRVAIQAFTCRAVPDSVKVSGLQPFYVDIEPDSVNMSPEALAHTIPDDVRVVVLQHTYGVPARVAEIAAFCDETERQLIEDCCHSVTAMVGGRRVGTFGLGGFTSFEWGKEIIAGVGGAAWANDAAGRAALQRHWRELSTPKTLVAARQAAQYFAFTSLYRPETYWLLKRAFGTLGRVGAIEANAVPEGTEEVDVAEYGKRLHPASARRVRRQLGRLESVSEQRVAMCGSYRREITSPHVRHVEATEDTPAGWVRYPLRVQGKDQLLERARRRRVELADWYVSPVDPLMADEGKIVGYEPGSCPHAERLAGEIVTLPTAGRVGSPQQVKAIDLMNTWTG